MTRWRTIAGALVLGALVLPARDQWRTGGFALMTWGRLRAAGRSSPASDVDRRFAQLALPLAHSRIAGLIISPSLPTAEAERVTYQVQYALAPCIVVRSDDAEFVILVGPLDAATRAPDAATFELQHQFDEQLRLYRRRAR